MIVVNGRSLQLLVFMEVAMVMDGHVKELRRLLGLGRTLADARDLLGISATYPTGETVS